MSDLPAFLHRTFFRTVSLLSPAGQGRFLRSYFEWFHRNPDPWRYAVDPYEITKYEVTLKSVPERPYDRILDVGCSEGSFTHRVAGAYPEAEVLGVDVSARAVRRASAVPCATAGDRRVGKARFAALDFLNQEPGGTFDLVVCAETLYYVGRGARLRAASGRLRSFMNPGASLILVHEWPESRGLYRHFDRDPLLRKVDEHVEEHTVRPYAVTRYERLAGHVRRSGHSDDRPSEDPSFC
ncbi:class I SAM-dependent methyltransferase [Rhizohabitans arisaemae]|uniref:class I SAM-dependent methyltransferase n=1 Tax=Rhizohabitans arisaemae TaxID=2720610 RepID=UPI0024B0DDF5|nr:class I SAM-dependent methyltransferase [Rhizohabitans arisaemae]